MTVDMRGCKEDIAKIKADSRGLDSLERQIQELFRLIAKKESGGGSGSSGAQEMARVQAIIKQNMGRM